MTESTLGGEPNSIGTRETTWKEVMLNNTRTKLGSVKGGSLLQDLPY